MHSVTEQCNSAVKCMRECVTDRQDGDDISSNSKNFSICAARSH